MLLCMFHQFGAAHQAVSIGSRIGRVARTRNDRIKQHFFFWLCTAGIERRILFRDTGGDRLQKYMQAFNPVSTGTGIPRRIGKGRANTAIFLDGLLLGSCAFLLLFLACGVMPMMQIVVFLQ